MKGYTDLGQEDFKVLATQACLGRISHPLEGIAARHARFGIYACEGEIVILWFEVGTFLLDELG